MSFIDSYKRLEKLCSEMYGDRGLSSYIDEMLGKPDGSYYVSGWNEDLKQLKHYRWVRNRIAHDPECTEENMCDFGDAEWIDHFYSRVMSTNDPLALYRKAKRPRTTQKPKHTYTPTATSYTPPQYKTTSPKPAGCLLYLMSALFVVAAVLWVARII